MKHKLENVKLMRLNKVNLNGNLYTEKSFEDGVDSLIDKKFPLTDQAQNKIDMDLRHLIGEVLITKLEDDILYGDVFFMDKFFGMFEVTKNGLAFTCSSGEANFDINENEEKVISNFKLGGFFLGSDIAFEFE